MRHFSIFDFENYVPSHILQRGHAYYKERRIREMDEMEPGEWYADAHGTAPEPYEVFVRLDADDPTIVEEYDCSCAYDLGICKHVVAFLYELRELVEAMSDEAPAEEVVVARQRTPEPEEGGSTRHLPEGRQREGRAASGVVAEAETMVDATQREWLERYRLLEPSTRVVWEVLAMFWSPIDQRRLKRIIDALPDDQAPRGLRLKEELELLRRIGLVETNGMGSYWVAEGPGHALTEVLFDPKNGFGLAIQAIRQTLPEHRGRQKFWHDEEALFREMRFARYLNDARAFLQAVRYLDVEAPNKYSRHQVVRFWLGDQIEPAQLLYFPKGIRSALALLVLELMLDGTLPIDQTFLDWLAEQMMRADLLLPSYVGRLARPLMLLYYFSGRFDAPMSQQMVAAMPDEERQAFELLARTWREDLDAVAPDYLKLFGSPFSRMRRHRAELPWLARFLAFVAALRTQPGGAWDAFEEKMEEHLAAAARNALFPHPDVAVLRHAGRALLDGDRSGLEHPGRTDFDDLDALFLQLFRQWCGLPVDEAVCETLASRFARRGMSLWEAEAHQLVRQARARAAAGQQAEANPVKERLGIVTLAETLRPRAAWELVLERLEQASAAGKEIASGVEERIAWFFDPVQRTLWPRHQKISVRTKTWTRGRRVTLFDLRTRLGELLRPDDWQLMRAVEELELAEIRLNRHPEILRHLCGHPHIFLADQPDLRVHFELVQATLVIDQTPEGYRFRLTPEVEGPGLHLLPVSHTRFLIVEVPEALAPVVELVQQADPVVPPAAGARLEQLVGRLQAHLPVLTDADVKELPEVEADPRIHIHLIPAGTAFALELLVKPLKETPPLLVPGEGDALVLGVVGGRRVRCVRALDEERRRRDALVALPAWRALEGKGASWSVPDSFACLSLLEALRPLVDAGEVVVEWPEGGAIGIARQIDLSEFRMRVAGTDYWFGIEGEVQVDEGRLLRLIELFDLLEQQDRFIELSPGEFVALTERLARQLRRLRALAEKRKNGLRVSKLGALALEELLQEVGQVETDAAFHGVLERARAAFAKNYELPPPDAFTATLRPYQREGYVWLRRLADWGVGACLADDMGLGKTVQALALMSVRAALGPQLVVAPASVCRNWVAEARKFTPGLRPRLFGEGDREKMIEAAGAGDLVIVTYDLMAREEALFTSRQWATIILDEAQAIKNYQTNRSRVAMRLAGDFRIIMTGTPVENHLGELWNLFHFINPGLLGDRESFRQRFALPIESGDELAREQLQRLVRPFILRRRKDEVLDDLPEKTEIVLDVPLSEEEQTFYEALRQRALDKLAGADRADGPGRIQILAELMRLRLAACHPRLVDPQAPVQHSSKLNLFAELVEELVDGGHKALVFSQFVKHLKLLEEVLQAKGIAYQYLDGQTPPRVRQQRIEAFQRGEGDVFLISLKAGGTGLNLTAADYVIHMDPWWNPAVEDQATDRAHRIGQERPVTVYRLVAAHTIEEKILKLHEEKRDLADALLAGTDASARLSLEDLMQLLQE